MTSLHASLRGPPSSTQRKATSTASNTHNTTARQPLSSSSSAATAASKRNGRGGTAAQSTATTTTTTAAAAAGHTPKPKLTVPLRGRWFAQAVAPNLHGCRAAAWIATWDKGSPVRRICLLEALKTLHSDSNSNALDEDLGDAAPLLFARLTSWWKLRYGAWVSEAANAARANLGSGAMATGVGGPAIDTAAPLIPSTASAATATATTAAAAATAESASPASSELLAQVEAMTIFVRGSRYLLQFAEGGGAAALCDCLETASSISVPGVHANGGTTTTVTAATNNAQHPAGPTVSAALGHHCMQERRAITLLLLYMANAGRVYREMVGDDEGLLHLLRALQRETETTVAIPMTELLAVLGQGHPRLSGSVQTGLLRVLASALAATSDPDSNNEVVVISTARAIRALQLQKEQHHYAQFQSGAFATATTAAASLSAASAVGLIDYVPIVGLDSAVSAQSFAGGESALPPSTAADRTDPLLQPFSRSEYIETLFQLALDDQHTAYRVEGGELLTLAAKNIRLTHDILSRCLDLVDQDAYELERDDAERAGVTQQRLLRQRRQLSSGRTAALVLISRPMTSARRRLLLQLMGQRSGHLTLLKYLRLTQHGDTAAVVDCCHALQFVARASTELHRQYMSHMSSAGASGGASETTLLRMTEGIQSALGDSVFQLLLFQDLTEEDCLAILRSAHAAVVA